MPPCSPDLNPIEFFWKDLKRYPAKLLSFDEAVTEASRIANELLMRSIGLRLWGSYRIFVVRDLYGQEVILLSVICRVKQVIRYGIDYTY